MACDVGWASSVFECARSLRRLIAESVCEKQRVFVLGSAAMFCFEFRVVFTWGDLKTRDGVRATLLLSRDLIVFDNETRSACICANAARTSSARVRVSF